MQTDVAEPRVRSFKPLHSRERDQGSTTRPRGVVGLRGRAMEGRKLGLVPPGIGSLRRPDWCGPGAHARRIPNLLREGRKHVFYVRRPSRHRQELDGNTRIAARRFFRVEEVDYWSAD